MHAGVTRLKPGENEIRESSLINVSFCKGPSSCSRKSNGCGEGYDDRIKHMNTEIQILEFKRLDPEAVLPTRGSVAAAGLDLYTIDDVRLAPGERRLARTGLAVAIPEGFYGRVAPRSGLAMKSGLDVLSGVIDADYRGEIGCLLYNTGNEVIDLPKHSKMCQLIIEKIVTPDAAWANDLAATARGSGGFGSTG
jgi:dUTP pyrophosphatase